MTTTTPQHLTALALANSTRGAMADRRRELRALPSSESRLLAAEWIADPDGIVARMQLGYLLESVRRFGDHRVARLLANAGIRHSALTRRIAAETDGQIPLTANQRSIIAEALRRGA
jgi:hypothetical protein